MWIKKSHFCLKDCKDLEYFPRSSRKCLLNQHLLVHTGLNINPIAQSSISLNVTFRKDYRSAEVIPPPRPRKKTKHPLHIHKKMLYIYEITGHRISRFNFPGCVVKKNPTNNQTKKPNTEQKNNAKSNAVAKNTEILHFFQTSRRAFALSKNWSAFISQIYTHV